MSFEIVVKHRIGERSIAVEHASDAALTAVTGPSGAGKTTLLNCIAGLIRPDSGRIAVAGTVLFDSTRNIDVPVHQRRAGYVFQDARLFPHMTVAGNLSYGGALNSDFEQHVHREDLIELLGIGGLLERWPATLSGGETRRVAIGRALLSAPRFLLLDEPVASLDAARAEEVLRMIEQLSRELAIPMLYVSHDAAEIARLTQSIIHLG